MKNNILILPFLAVIAAQTETGHAATLSTTFSFTEVSSGNWTNLFDLTVTNPAGVQITHFTVHILQAPVPRTLQVYVRPTTYVGSENTLTGWSLLGTGSNVEAGFATGAALIDVTDFILPAGTYGMALVNTNYQMGYTTGATDYNNADLVIDNGATVRGPLSGQVDANKTWNGTITYQVVPEPASAVIFAAGLLGVMGRRRRSQL